MRFPALLTPFFLSCVHAETLHVALYNGNVTTLELTQTSNDGSAGLAATTEYSLVKVNTISTSVTNPAWLSYNKQNQVLYLLDGVTTGNGTISSWRAGASGVTPLASVECPLDGAYAGFYMNGIRLVVAHYTSSALRTYEITSNGAITPLQTFTYSMDKPGPVESRQTAPHPHMALEDPMGQYIIVNDLGADLLRVYAIDQTTGELSERATTDAAPGSGPRHGVFTKDPIPVPGSTHERKYVYYLDAEIAGTVTAYWVTYLPDLAGLQFDEIQNYSTLAPGVAQPACCKGVSGEIRMTRDGDYVIITNRRDAPFNATEAQFPPNGTSDSVNTYRVRQDLGGTLDFMQTFPAGGQTPRTMTLNAAEDLLAVASQLSESVAILRRDRETGLVLEQVAQIDVGDQPWGIVWQEAMADW